MCQRRILFDILLYKINYHCPHMQKRIPVHLDRSGPAADKQAVLFPTNSHHPWKIGTSQAAESTIECHSVRGFPTLINNYTARIASVAVLTV